MADVGPAPEEIQRKIIEVEIMRLQHQIGKQEIDVLNKHDEIRRYEGNIEASRREIDKQKEKLAAIGKPAPTAPEAPAPPPTPSQT